MPLVSWPDLRTGHACSGGPWRVAALHVMVTMRERARTCAWCRPCEHGREAQDVHSTAIASAAPCFEHHSSCHPQRPTCRPTAKAHAPMHQQLPTAQRTLLSAHKPNARTTSLCSRLHLHRAATRPQPALPRRRRFAYFASWAPRPTPPRRLPPRPPPPPPPPSPRRLRSKERGHTSEGATRTVAGP